MGRFGEVGLEGAARDWLCAPGTGDQGVGRGIAVVGMVRHCGRVLGRALGCCRFCSWGLGLGSWLVSWRLDWLGSRLLGWRRRGDGVWAWVGAGLDILGRIARGLVTVLVLRRRLGTRVCVEAGRVRVWRRVWGREIVAGLVWVGVWVVLMWWCAGWVCGVWFGAGIEGRVWVGVGDAEDLCGGEADGLGVCWACGLLCGDVFERAEGGRASEGVCCGASGVLDGLEACDVGLECL